MSFPQMIFPAIQSAVDKIKGVYNSANDQARQSLRETQDLQARGLSRQAAIDVPLYGSDPNQNIFERAKMALADRNLPGQVMAGAMSDMVKNDPEKMATYKASTGQPLTVKDKFLAEKSASDRMMAAGQMTGSMENVAGKAITKIANPLIQEARKYKSAEEFIQAQGLYHGTPGEIIGGKLSIGAGSGIKKGGQSGGLFLSDNPQVSQVFGKNVYQAPVGIKNEVIDLTSNSGLNKIKEFIGKKYKTMDGETLVFTQEDFNSMFPGGKTDFASISQYPEVVQKIVDSAGKKGIAFDEYAGGVTGKTYQILNGDVPVYTKSQLTDIYNQAKGKQYNNIKGQICLTKLKSQKMARPPS